MTVASLWKVLDNAGCGKAVGAQDMLNPDHAKNQTNPWNYNEMAPIKPQNCPSLAVDLSIWICEALTSTAMAENHSNPVLHLVFTRTTKLLHLGIKLVIVIEGKRRIRQTEEGENDKFRKRRNGTGFWKACKACEEMMEFLGVPVVKAKAEGEALCAILNQRGIVDGVISNDGDCLLFGAKVVYTRFSIENLQQSQIIRYDADDLRALVNESNEDDIDNTGVLADTDQTIKLSRQDLISFALLTGSDLAGNGLPKVGGKKAIRFIYKCQRDNPLSSETSAIDELKSWAVAAKANTVVLDGAKKNRKSSKERCCTVCLHPGNKRNHEKHGCELCDTKPGEPCLKVSCADQFRKSLRKKALAMRPRFEPAQVVDAYMKPNDNQVPLLLVGESSRSLRMKSPQLTDMLNSSLIVKGYSRASSAEFVTQSMGRLLARQDLFDDGNKISNKNASKRTTLSKEQPVPVQITRALTRDRVPCYEVNWHVGGTITDAEGNDIDGHEFTTIESRKLVDKRYPDLVDAFNEAEKEKQKQGDAEQRRRRHFLEDVLKIKRKGHDEIPEEEQPPKKKKARKPKKKKQTDFFEKNRSRNASRPREQEHPRRRKSRKMGDDVEMLMRFVNPPKVSEATTSEDNYDYSSISSKSMEYQHEFEEVEVSHVEKSQNLINQVIEVDARRTKKKAEENEVKVIEARPEKIAPTAGVTKQGKETTAIPNNREKVASKVQPRRVTLEAIVNQQSEKGSDPRVVDVKVPTRRPESRRATVKTSPVRSQSDHFDPCNKNHNEEEMGKVEALACNLDSLFQTVADPKPIRTAAGTTGYQTPFFIKPKRSLFTRTPGIRYQTPFPNNKTRPSLSPEYSVVCDMGIAVKVTPIVSKKLVTF